MYEYNLASKLFDFISDCQPGQQLKDEEQLLNCNTEETWAALCETGI